MFADNPVFPILLSEDVAASRAFYHDTLADIGHSWAAGSSIRRATS